ncbi:ATPdependent RNA helicase [Phytophthora boehmeriae]|uniref:ATPdependent RNA helicase n=1 Tax=Phytophthora boehmeriae TaxID=109152 RepID=A0A8T1WUI8_9STRA|nr:ATPdependent RNA helicase [Phytophthora boehmeriae]
MRRQKRLETFLRMQRYQVSSLIRSTAYRCALKELVCQCLRTVKSFFMLSRLMLQRSSWALQAQGRRHKCLSTFWKQPRRVAAVTIAERVAQELGCPVGDEVGYAVRFEDKWDPERTKIKFVTDGLLLRETMRDPLLARYSVVMLDEAHERNLETDLLLGLIKKIQRKRPDLRLIIASATLQVDTFVRFFRSKKKAISQKKPSARSHGLVSADCSTPTLKDVVAVSVEGRQFPVDIEYLQEPCNDYLQKAIETVLAIDKYEGEGDILVFLPGQEEIDFVVRALSDSVPAHILPVPLYGTLPLHMQQNAFLSSPKGVRRKVIVATTIAETSVTIEGVVFVIDGDGGEEGKECSATVRKCLVSGYFANAARLHADGVYRTLRDQRSVQLHPTCVYYHMGTLPDWIVFHQSVLTTEEFVRDVSKIDPRWLVDLAPDFYRAKEKQNTASKDADKPPRRSITNSDGRIMFRKPKRSSQGSTSKLPVHIGKSKGGLRSQF